jgi:hypothetical protein
MITATFIFLTLYDFINFYLSCGAQLPSMFYGIFMDGDTILRLPSMFLTVFMDGRNPNHQTSPPIYKGNEFFKTRNARARKEQIKNTGLMGS